ncbi:MAG: response regulator [Phycisphaerales bacterium]|nr:response regulator [Phycisphaerales bacterium]
MNTIIGSETGAVLASAIGRSIFMNLLENSAMSPKSTQLKTVPLTVLVVDDEPDLVELIAYNLQQQGHTVLTACNGAEAIDQAKSRQPDLIVLDVMMPELNGIEVARRLRSRTETASVPIIMLTAKTEEAHEIEGLGAGADDYITKPFSMQVLMARIDAMARRTGGTSASGRDSVLTLGAVSIDLDEHQVSVDGTPVSLTITEFRLLSTLFANEGKVMTRPALISSAIGPGVTVTERTIDVHVTALRKKITPYSSMISTVRGVGYRADAPQTVEQNA